MFKKAKTTIFVLILVFIVSSLAYSAPKQSVAFDALVLSRIDGQRALEHIRVLSEQIGPRVAGTESERVAAAYIRDTLDKYGYEVEVQEFGIRNIIPQLIVNGQNIRSNAAVGSGATTVEGVTAEVVDCGFGSPTEFPDGVEGKIALIKRGFYYFSEKVKNAENAGAIGVILYNNVDTPLYSTLGDYVSSVPVVAVRLSDGVSMLQEMENGPLTATIIAELFDKSQNITARKLPKVGNSGIVYVTAHYDSVPGAPGANDNASGTAMLLEFARILKAYPINKEIRFIAFGAEEIGLDGSYYYVEKLKETADEIDRSVAVFNMDMIATSYENASLLYINTVDGKPNLVSQSAEAAGARLGNDTLYLNMGGSSDHVPFYLEGIDAANFIRRAPVTGALEPYYHTPQDTIAINISLNRLQESGEIIGSALYDVLRKPVPSLERSRVRIPREDMEHFFRRGVAK